MTGLDTVNDPVFNNFARLSIAKKYALDLFEVRNGLTSIEMRVAKAGTKKPVKILTDEELSKKISNSIEFIARDLGIKNFTGEDATYETTRFFQLLKNYYGELTFEEVKVAFELSMIGALSEWLEKGHGHYQNFSFEYITGVLSAYREYRKKTWTKVNILCPVYSQDSTEDEKQENRRVFLLDIIEKFNLYKEKKERPEFIAPFLVVNEFSKMGMSNEVQISEEDKKNGFLKAMSSSFKSSFEKSKMANDMKKGVHNFYIDVCAKREAHTKEIVRIFDEIIKSGMDIEDIIKI